jgi:hypothetical protein
MEEDKGTRRIGHKGKDLLQVFSPCTLVSHPPHPHSLIFCSQNLRK